MIFKRYRVLHFLSGLALVGWALFLKNLSWMAFSHTEPGPHHHQKTFLVKPGATLTHIAFNLEKEGFIKSPLSFQIHSFLQGTSKYLKAGEYKFSPYASQKKILETLYKGEVIQHSITLPEGVTLEQALTTFNTDPNLKGSPLSEEDLERFPPLAETYFFTKGTTRKNLLKRMNQDLQDLLGMLWEERDSAFLLKTPSEALILSSIVEKETAIPSERPMIAAVFLNRLKIGMPLQSDPTVSYGLFRQMGRPLNKTLSRKELKIPHIYNTYLNKGLPPYPIALVGKEALIAVFSPAKSKNLYFVADGTGGHAFSKTLKEHQKNHAQWRRIRNNSK